MWLPLNLQRIRAPHASFRLPSLRYSYGGSAEAFGEGGKPEATQTFIESPRRLIPHAARWSG